METNIPGVKQRLLLPAHHDARRAERVAGIVEFERRRDHARLELVKGGPFDLAIELIALEQRSNFVHFDMGEQRILFDAEFLALARHHVHRIVQHALDQEITQLREQYVRLWEMPHRHRQ